MSTILPPPAPPAAAQPPAFVAPASDAQRRLWFLERLRPGTHGYNLGSAHRLRGPLDADALDRAVVQVVRRHESLRTRFAQVDDEPVQVVEEWSTIRLVRRDADDADVARLAREEAERPFDLERGPLFRATLLRVGDEDHVLLLYMHHVVSDGWSAGVLYRELAALYAAELRGESASLPELEIQYADYAAWQRSALSGERLNALLAYWRSALGDAPRVLELPADHPRPPMQSYRGGRVEVRIDAEVADGLRAIARAEGATLYMVLLAAFQLLLSRYAQQDQVLVGTPVANRGRPELEDLIGFFAGTLVLRGDLRGAPSFRELVGRVREQTLGAYAHQELPFERLVEALEVERDLSRNPLFQVMFTLQNAPGEGLRLDRVRAERLPVEYTASKFDLTLSMIEDGTGLRGWLEYSADLFERATAERMAEHLGVLLRAAAADPAQHVCDLPLMTDAERRRVVQKWNATDRPAWDGCIHQRIAEQARRTPDAVAVVADDGRLSYAQLDARANALAWRLRARGVGPEARVGVLLHRSAELVTALLGVMKAGGCYVPLDPEHPPDRLRWIAEDADVRVVVSTSELAPRLGDDAREVVRIEDADAAAALSAARESGPESGAGPENLAYVIYTSGSTGRPKGAMNTHRAVLNRLSWMQRAYPLEAGEGVLHKTPFGFDVSVWELFWPLLVGARMVVAPPGAHREPRALATLIQREAVTTVHFVPSMLPAFLDEERGAGCATLRRVVCSGEALAAELARRFCARLPGVALENLYGPTEAAVDVSRWSCVPGAAASAVPIGHPVDNTRLYVLDPRGAPCPVGVPGELHIGGVQVGRGYLRRPALTAERFVPDPFGAAGGRLYRTGDRARRRADGALEFLGRTDFQVKLRGFRIEPGEVEAALRAHPGVRDAVVTAPRDAGGEPRLVAYATPAHGALDECALREHLRRALPEYMVPAAVVVLPALPLTANGKVDRAALPAPSAPEQAGLVAPRTPVEQALADIWAEVLGPGRVGVHDDFFARGGHSLRAVQVTSRIRRALGVELPVRAVFEAPTIAGLAERIARARGEAAPAASHPIPRVERGGPLPVSDAQRRLWFLERLQPGTHGYNLGSAYRLRGPVDADALERAVATVVRRHESLRTRFAAMDGEPVQVVDDGSSIRLLRQSVNESDVARVAAEKAERPFDLERGPLFRATLLRVGDEEHVLLLYMHHMVSDGWSAGILYRELAALYAAELRGESAGLPELEIQYADYAAWQRSALSGERLDALLAYWRSALEGAPRVLELPVDHPRPPMQSYRGGRVEVRIDAEVADGLRAIARTEGATLYMVLLAAFQLLLSRYAQQDEVLVGTPVANRGRPELEDLIGFFAGTLVLRGDLRGAPSFRELAGRIREQTLGAYAHQELPFERLVEALEVERDLGRNPLFQVMFALQNAPGEGLRLEGVRTERLPVEYTTSKFDLTLSMVEEGDGIGGVLEYSADLFERATAERMAEHLGVLLRAAAADPAQRVSDLPLMGDEERRRVLEAWSVEPGGAAPSACIHQLFAQQARRTPDAVALIAGDGRISYAQLDARANALAWRLRARGVGPEARVGVLLQRGTDLVAALLGVMKAGGCYVPLDPEHPAERLRWMVDDADARVVVSTAELAPRLGDVAVVRIEDADDAAAPESGVTAQNLAYVIYTSGSTGRPKGVMVAHGQAAAHCLDAGARLGLGPADRVLQFASPGFDVALEQLLAPLFRGAAAVLRGALPWSPGELLRAASAIPLTVVDLPPDYLATVLEHPAAGELRRLRAVLAGGEALGPHAVRRWHAAGTGGARLVNAYGPTEAVITATAFQVPPAPRDPGPAVPIGRPLAGRTAYVLDPRGSPCPPGVPGELHLGGAGLARGYLGRPALTAERFVPDPFGAPGGRLYRTGDRARWRPGGTLEFAGRVDAQVKLRGFRIEPGEVEAALLAHPGVRAVRVGVSPGASGHPLLAAWVVPRGDAPPPRESLAAAAAARLPPYMLPDAYVFLDALPTTPSGKVDLRALPPPDAPPQAPGAPPGTETERAVAAAWGDVLGREVASVHDRFFDLGGNSLLLLKLQVRLSAALGREVAVADLFRHPTVAAQAAHLRGAAPSVPRPEGADRGALRLARRGQRRHSHPEGA